MKEIAQKIYKSHVKYKSNKVAIYGFKEYDLLVFESDAPLLMSYSAYKVYKDGRAPEEYYWSGDLIEDFEFLEEAKNI